MEFQDVVRRRRMVRRFTPEPVAAAIRERLLANATRAPSAGFSQGWRFLVLESGVDRTAFWSVLRVDMPVDESVTEAPLVIVPMGSRDEYLSRYAEPDKGWVDRDAARFRRPTGPGRNWPHPRVRPPCRWHRRRRSRTRTPSRSASTTLSGRRRSRRDPSGSSPSATARRTSSPRSTSSPSPSTGSAPATAPRHQCRHQLRADRRTRPRHHPRRHLEHRRRRLRAALPDRSDRRLPDRPLPGLLAGRGDRCRPSPRRGGTRP